MLTPCVKATLLAPTPTRPTPAKERRSRRPGLPFPCSRSATSARSRSPARVNLIATKERGGNSATATLTTTGLVPRKRTARSSEASVSVAALFFDLVTDPKSTVCVTRSLTSLALRSLQDAHQTHRIRARNAGPPPGAPWPLLRAALSRPSGKGVRFDARTSSVSSGRRGPLPCPTSHPNLR